MARQAAARNEANSNSYNRRADLPLVFQIWADASTKADQAERPGYQLVPELARLCSGFNLRAPIKLRTLYRFNQRMLRRHRVASQAYAPASGAPARVCVRAFTHQLPHCLIPCAAGQSADVAIGNLQQPGTSAGRTGRAVACDYELLPSVTAS